MNALGELYPNRVFHYFQEISGIPRGSGHTDKIKEYLLNFAGEHGFSAAGDAAGNVVIKKPGTAGYENSPTVILQGHSDMVCEKVPGSSHDFLTEGLQLKAEGDYLFAEGTTLGGDDGIAVAYILAILESTTIPHPPLEAVITADEEIGLLGAAALDLSGLEGRLLINLDSEEEGHLLCGCAGGMTEECRIPMRFGAVSALWYEVRISGLLGGHSGSEIHKNRANSNLLAGRLLYRLGRQMEFVLSELSGGTKDNAIPRETRMLIGVDSEDAKTLEETVGTIEREFQKEYRGCDEGITVTAEAKGAGTQPALHPTSLQKAVFFLMNVPNGVEKMSGEIPGLVETSSNLGILNLKGQELAASVSVRSSIGSAKTAVGDRICYLTEFLGGDCHTEGAYPAWEFKGDSPLRDKMTAVYRDMYGTEPVTEVIHAGLECGLFYDGIPGLDCVSLGPDILDIHTTEEKLSISSAGRVYEYLLRVLQELK